jgi:hypothetical protein
MIVLPLDAGEISDTGLFDGKVETNTAYFRNQAEAYCEDLSGYLYDKIPALASDTI